MFCQGPSSKKWKAEISDPSWYFHLYNSKDLAGEKRKVGQGDGCKAAGVEGWDVEGESGQGSRFTH